MCSPVIVEQRPCGRCGLRSDESGDERADLDDLEELWIVCHHC